MLTSDTEKNPAAMVIFFCFFSFKVLNRCCFYIVVGMFFLPSDCFMIDLCFFHSSALRRRAALRRWMTSADSDDDAKLPQQPDVNIW